MYILAHEMDIFAPKMYTLAPKMDKSLHFEKVQPQWQLLYLFSESANKIYKIIIWSPFELCDLSLRTNKNDFNYGHGKW